MENILQQFADIRTESIDGEPWFIGCDVAKMLGYKNSRNIIGKAVCEEDKRSILYQVKDNYKSKIVIINESGLYSLILAAQTPEAEPLRNKLIEILINNTKLEINDGKLQVSVCINNHNKNYEPKTYSVYWHHNNINGMNYFGITKGKPETRWNNGQGYKGQLKFYNAIEEFGWNNFDHIILKTNLTRAQAYEIERELIDKYNSIDSGYNNKLGGTGYE